MSIVLPLPIQTERLTIRAPVRSDMRLWAALNRNLRARKFLNGPLRRPAKKIWAELADHSGDHTRPLAVALQGTGEFIGQCGLLQSSQRPKEIEVYCVLRPAHWKNGYAPELCRALIRAAFEIPRVKRIVGIVHPDNVSSLSLVQRLGFKRIGTYDCPLRDWQHGHTMLALSQATYNYSSKPTADAAA